MRIVIDMQGAQAASRHRGIGKYTISLINAMVRENTQHEIFLVLNGVFADTIGETKEEYKDLIEEESILVWYPKTPTYGLSEEHILNRKESENIYENFILNLSPDFVLITNMFESHNYCNDAITTINLMKEKTNVGVILYDLIPLLNPMTHLSQDITRQWYFEKLSFLENADLLLSISESAKNEGVENLLFYNDKIVNISSAVSKIYRPLEIENKLEILSQFNISKPFIMHTGGLDERKNVKGLIKAYSLLSKSLRDAYQLVIVFDLDYNTKKSLIEYSYACGLEENELILTGFIDDNLLLKLYNLCELFVFPSLHEGFGLPPLEAMSCGKATIASNTSSLPEVIGREDALFDPLDVNSIANKISDVLLNKAFKKELEHHAIEYAKNFSWEISARKTINAMENFITNKIKEKQFFIDISELVQRDARSGIQRVVRSILKELLVNPPLSYKVKAVYATDNEIGYCYADKFIARFLGRPDDNVVDEKISYGKDDIFLGLDFQPNIIPYQEAYYQQLRDNGVKVYFIVYDILCILKSQFFPDGAKEGFTKWLKTICKNNGIFCISKAVRDELDLWIKDNNIDLIDDFKLDWFHLGADVRQSVPSLGLPQDANEVIAKLKDKTTFLLVSTLEPRKGHKQTLEAFEKLWKDNININLVFVGKNGWMMDDTVEKIKNHQELNNKLYWLEGISDEYLEKIYMMSDCLLSPSEGEGFGLPLIEAFQHNLPIIARDLPVFKEVSGENAYYFDNTTDSDVIVKTIKSWLELYSHKQHPTSDGVTWLSWKDSTENLKKIIN